MAVNDEIDLTSYLKRVGAISALLLTGGIAAHVTNLKQPVLNPPIGAFGDYWLPIALFAGLGITLFLPYLLRPISFKMQLALTIVLLAALVGEYGWALIHFGRPIDIPIRNVSDYVIVGTFRTPFANKYFVGVRDVDMMLAKGWSEDHLALYWTESSLAIARLLVLLGYIGSISSLNLLACVVAANSAAKTSKSARVKQE